MKLVGYTRTRLVEELGEHDLEEQERALAEFCSVHAHELTSVMADEGEGPQAALTHALDSAAEGIVITDPLVIGETIDAASNFVSRMVAHKKHLFIVFHEKHIDPNSGHPEEELISQSLSLLNHQLN
jgi:hypothetical protein